MNRYRMLLVQTSTQPPNMHLKLTKHGRFCKQNNQLPTKSHDELKDNSNVSKSTPLHVVIFQFVFINLRDSPQTPLNDQ